MNLNDTVVLELTIVLKSKIKNMKKINLKNAENALSREEMKSINGGRSVLYCTLHNFHVTILGLEIGNAQDYDKCRKSRRQR